MKHCGDVNCIADAEFTITFKHEEHQEPIEPLYRCTAHTLVEVIDFCAEGTADITISWLGVEPEMEESPLDHISTSQQ
jgi:hypothetical protein